MIEHWRQETHTFHLPIDEATIMLEDVEVLFEFLVDGMAVSYPHALRDYTGDDYLHMLQRLAGFQPAEPTSLSGASRLQLLPFRQHLVALHAEITDGLTTGGYRPTDELPDYSWDGAVLAYLYRQLCRSSMGTVRDIAGFIPLLQVWAWEWFLQIQPPLPPIALDAPPPSFLPLSWRWVDKRGHAREVEAGHHLPYYRNLLDLLEDDQVIWRPYSDELIVGFPDYCSRGQAM
ncbi:serine/threonine-protein phosphatase 7 long form homolog [Nicotiana tabacum]|uniref:Serine/threonine-protein phosphatase 7 long form homolog n=1 Tax=Nicotiana tabacum TaxID=4097 RepID=A0AC58TDT8_TOBAC